MESEFQNDLDALSGGLHSIEPELENLVLAQATGEEINKATNFLNSLAPAVETEAPKPEKPSTPKPKSNPNPGRPDEIAVEFNKAPKRIVKDAGGEIIGEETVDSLLPAPDAAKADKESTEVASPDNSAVGAAQANVDALAAGAPEEGLGGTVKKVAADLGEGAAEAPLQAAGGVADGINNFIKLGDILQEKLPLPGVQIFDTKGNFSPEFLSSSQVTERRKAEQEEGGGFLPTTDKGDTVTGGMVRTAAQFVMGFRMGGGMLGMDKIGTAAFLGRSTAQGLFSDIVAFDGHEANLANVIQSFPKLQTPITAFLATDTEDSELENRLKNGIVGLIPDSLISGLLLGLRAVKRARAVKAATGARTYTQAGDALALELKSTGQFPASGSGDVFRAIGDSSPEAPLTNLRAAEKATELPVPTDVAAKGVAGSAREGMKFTDEEAAKLGMYDGPAVRVKGEVFVTKFNSGSDSTHGDAVSEAVAKFGEAEVNKALEAGEMGWVYGKGDTFVRSDQVGRAAKDADGPFINFARINTDDDIKSVLRDMADAFKDDVSTAQRGVQSNAQTIAKASKKYDEVWKDLIGRRVGELSFNAEEQLAMRHLWTASGEKLLDTAKLAEASPTAENLLAFRKMLTVHYMVQNQALAVRTETARALQQWNIPAGVGGKEKINAMQNILLQHGGADVNIDLVRKFAGLADEVAANPNNMSKVSAAAEKASKATTLKAVNELWIGLGLLSGLKTQMRNLISNMGMTVAGVAEKAIAARTTGLLDQRSAIAVGEASAQVSAMFFNTKKAWMDAADTFKTGKMKTGLSQIDIPPEMAMRSMDQNTLLGKTMRALSPGPQTIFSAMSAGDQFFKTLNFEGEVGALALRDAVNAVQDGRIPKEAMKEHSADFIANLPKWAEDSAMDKAAYRTFTNEPGELTRYILRGRNQFPASRFIIPFVNITANIFRTSLEFSPLAPLLTKYKNAIAKGGADAALARTRLGVGTTAMLAFIDMSMEGKLTGGGPPPGSAEYAALRRTGWRPYTVKIGDKWVSYRGVEPFSTIMGVGADLGDYLRYAEDSPDDIEGIKDMLSIGIFSAAENMLDRSNLTGMANMIAAVTDSKRNGAAWIDNFASSFIPRALTDVRNATDTTVRDARTMADKFKTRIPYMSMTVPERRDEWGRVQSMESGWGTAYDVMSPFYASQINAEPIDAELIRQGFGAGGAVRSMRLDGVPISFKNRADIHNRYLELRGQKKASDLDKKLFRRYGDSTMLEVLNGMVTGDHKLAMKYAKASDGEGGEKHKLIQKVVRDYGRAARKILVEEFPEIRDRVAEEEMKRQDRFEEGDAMADELLGVE